MKLYIILLLSLFTFNGALPAQSKFPAISSNSDVDMTGWVEQHFGRGKTPPFSFVYGGKHSNSFIQKWHYKAENVTSSEENEEVNIYTYTDPKTGLEVKCTVTSFTDFPAVEWVLHFKNTSGRNTPVIEKVVTVDQSFQANQEGPVILHHARGSDARIDDFAPIDETIPVGKKISMIQNYGRSSSHDAFPFFNLEMSPNEGVVVAIGWSGRWFADITHQQDKTIALQSGLLKMQSTLYPNEEIRSSRVCLLFWQGENRMAGHNSFRRFVLKHHSHKKNGRFAEYPISAGFGFGDSSPSPESECLTEAYALAIVDRHRQLDMIPDIFWLDAGWYQGCECGKWDAIWWNHVGSWTADKERFPNGLRPITDAAHAIGSKFMLWFEPERVCAGSIIHKEHPEWLIQPENTASFLFDLGNEDARLWLTNYLCDFIKKEGIDYYRQDFNIDPAGYWDMTDKPGRTGITENKHIQGLYAFWDDILARFPDLLIDNCASGGRRLDLETISRSASLWRTDYQYGEIIGKQCHTFALNLYLPLHGTSTSMSDVYSFRSGLGAAVQAAWLIGSGYETADRNRKYMEECKELRPYFYGDYYPLTPFENYTHNNMWLAYQLDRPNEKDGIVMIFRRQDNQEKTRHIQWQGLDKNADYEVFYTDYGITSTYSGEKLMKGLDITIPEHPGSLLIKYKQVK